MRYSHFESLAPVCPVCRGNSANSEAPPLVIGHRLLEVEDQLIEGILQCSNRACLREYPVIDGIPILVVDLRGFVTTQLATLQQRSDLSAEMESLLGDCVGQGTAFEATRQQLSSYGWDHYGDQSPELAKGQPAPGSVRHLTAAALQLAGDLPEGPILDLGCGAGRSSFELAQRTGRDVLGLDLNFALLRLAEGVLRGSEARFPLRQVGLVYEEQRITTNLPAAERVDFWAADVLALPFHNHGFAAVQALNLLDCVSSPRDALAAIGQALVPKGKAMVASPWDWSSGATPVQNWLGGHSQRSSDRGATEPVLRSLLTPEDHPAGVPGLILESEQDDLPWRVRVHSRSHVEYRVHLTVAVAG